MPSAVMGQLIRADADTGRGQVVAEGIFLNLRLSPSRRYVASLQVMNIPTHVDFDPVVHSVETFAPQQVLRVLDISQRERAIVLSPCEDCVVSAGSISWDTRDDVLLYFAKRRGALWREGSYFRYDPRSKTARPIKIDGLAFKAPATVMRPDPEPCRAVSIQGHTIAPVNTGNELQWSLEEGERMHTLTARLVNVSPEIVALRPDGIVVLADGELWKLTSGGRRSHLTGHLPKLVFPGRRNYQERLFGDSERDPQLQAVVFVQYLQEGRRVAAFVDIESRATHVSAILDVDELMVGISSTRPMAVVLRSDRHGIQLSRAMAGQPPQLFAHLNAFLSQFTWPKRQLIGYTLGSKQLVACVVSAQGNTDPLPPLVALVYPETSYGAVGRERCTGGYETGSAPGPDMVTRQGALVGYWTEQFLSSLGYTVVYPATPNEVLNSDREALSGLGALIEAGVNAAAERGLGDGRRVGLFGLSQGGFSVLKILTQSKRYRAAVAANSSADFASDYGMFGPVRAMLSSQIMALGRKDWFVIRRQSTSTPWDDPGWFVRSSPYFAARNIETPLLLIQSDLDTNFPMADFDQMFTALSSRGQEVDYVRYWGEGHGVTSPANIRDFAARVEAWFGERLTAP